MHLDKYLEASDELILSYSEDCSPEPHFPIKAVLEFDNATEAIACVIALTECLGNIRSEFIDNIHGACSSNAHFNSMAFKQLLRLHDQLREAAIAHDVARWGEPREFETWGATK